MYCNRSQMTSQHVNPQKVQHETKSSGVTVVDFTTCCDVFCDLEYYSTHARKNVIYILVLYNKNSNGLLKDFGGMKKEKQVR